MRRALLITCALVLVAAPSALAGGWASATFDSSPAGTAAGKPWQPKLTVLQHGQTPIDDLQPAVIIRDAKGVEKRFEAVASSKPGVYDVSVVFPSKGKYTYSVDDGFGNAHPHDFSAVQIGSTPAAAAPAGRAPVAPADDSGMPWWVLGLGGVVALSLAVALMRRRSTSPAPAAPGAASSSA